MEIKVLLENTTRSVHPQVISEIGLAGALALLEVAQDLRSGAISAEQFDMNSLWSDCGSVGCIAGWAMFKLGHEDVFTDENDYWIESADGVWRLARLFGTHNPSDPLQAADAIERYVYEWHSDPWLTGTRSKMF